MVTALAIGEVVLTTLMDIEFPNKIIPFELKHKRITLSGMLTEYLILNIACAIEILNRNNVICIDGGQNLMGLLIS